MYFLSCEDGNILVQLRSCRCHDNNKYYEIALQCLCYGNGKRSPYLYGAIILGVAILPDYYNYYFKSYKTGKRANPFHHFDYQKLLSVSIADLRGAIFPKSEFHFIFFFCMFLRPACGGPKFLIYIYIYIYIYILEF